jgi:hypothetical protein
MLETARVMENNIFWSSDHTFVYTVPSKEHDVKNNVSSTQVNLTSHKKSYQGTMARSVSVSEREKRAHEQFVICKNIQNRDQVARLLTFILILHVHYITLITPTLEPVEHWKPTMHQTP